VVLYVYCTVYRYSIVVIIRLYFIFYDEDKCTVPGISLISASRVQTSFDIPPLRLACLLSTLLLRLKFEEDRGGLPLMPGRLILLLLVERACAESALPRDGLRPWLSIIVDQSPESNSALPSSRVGWSKAYDDSRSRLPILRPKYVLRVSSIFIACARCDWRRFSVDICSGCSGCDGGGVSASIKSAFSRFDQMRVWV